MQGGAFSPRGDLYLMSSRRSVGPLVLDPGGISLWSPGGSLLQRSQNASGLGGFKYEFHTGDDEEPEGLDWWNRSRRPATPHVRGQLHAFLLDNDSSSDDDLYLKHYTGRLPLRLSRPAHGRSRPIATTGERFRRM